MLIALLRKVQAPVFLWPLSEQSLPTWTAILTVLVTAFLWSFVASSGAKDLRDEKKRDSLLRVLDTILEYVAKKDQEAAKALKQPAEDEGEDDEDFGPEGMPEASRVMDLLWDNVHGIRTTEYGISAQDPRYGKAQALLKRLAALELRKAVHRTKQAVRIAKGEGAVPRNSEEINEYFEYRSGENLREVIEFQSQSLKKHLGAEYVDEQQLQQAEAYLKEVYQNRSKHMAKVFSLVAPHVPMLLFCVVLLMIQTLFQSVFHQIGYWMLPVEMAVAGDYAGMRFTLLQIFVGHVIFDVVNTVREAFEDRACTQLHSSVTQGVLQALLQQDYEYFDRTNPGVLQERLNHDADQLGHNLIYFPQEILRMVVEVLACLLIVYRETPTDLFMMAIAPLGPIMVLQFFIIRFWQRMDDKMCKLDESSAASTGETLREIKTVRQFAMESQESDKFAANSVHCRILREQVSTSHRIVGCLFGLSIYGGLVFTVWLGAYRVNSGEMTVAGLMDLTFKLNFNVVHTLRRLIEQLPRFNRLMQPLARISELLESSPKIEPTFGETSGLRPRKFHGLIEFDNVHFAYPTDPRKRILNGLTFTIEPGQKVALIGSTGCGKSSTMSLLQRLYDPQQGCIRIDGRPLKDYDLRYLRQRIVIVDQFTVLFASSVRDNIIYGMDGATDKEIEQACKEAQAWDFLQEKPDKLMTMVSSGGSNFSGGQRQRIAIARAIVRDPDVILLDEATASLDNENEKLVQTALDKLARKGSALVIAHRLSTIKDSDKIVVIDKGMVVEEGSHDELLARGSAEFESSAADMAAGPLPPPAPLCLAHAVTDAPWPAIAKFMQQDESPLSFAPPPPLVELTRASTCPGVTSAHGERGHVTYRKLWDASAATKDKMTMRQMQQNIDQMEVELSQMKSKVRAIRTHTSSLHSPLPAWGTCTVPRLAKKLSAISDLRIDGAASDVNEVNTAASF